MKLTVKQITTDGHTSIKAYIRDKWPEVQHHFDTWHIAKGVCKYVYWLVVAHWML